MIYFASYIIYSDFYTKLHACDPSKFSVCFKNISSSNKNPKIVCIGCLIDSINQVQCLTKIRHVSTPFNIWTDRTFGFSFE